MLNQCRVVVAGVVGGLHLIGGVEGDGERLLAPIDADIACRCLCCVCHRWVPPVGYSCIANRARVLSRSGVSGVLPLQGFGLWFVGASGVGFGRACCPLGVDAPTPVAFGGEPRQTLVLVVIYQGGNS